MAHFDTLHDLLIAQLQDLYDSEHQLISAVPRMEAAAKSQELRRALTDHCRETCDQAARLYEVFLLLGTPPERKICVAMQGLIREADEAVGATGDPNVIDAAIIAAAQRIEHFEMSAYASLKALARHSEHSNIVSILDESMNEEIAANKLLTKIAEGSLLHESVNKAAARI